MVRKRGGIGALGSAQARFLHPIAKIREKWLNDHKGLRLEILVVTGKELFRISWKGLEEKPIMWRVKLKEGKDRLKKPDGSCEFPSKFPG